MSRAAALELPSVFTLEGRFVRMHVVHVFSSNAATSYRSTAHNYNYNTYRINLWWLQTAELPLTRHPTDADPGAAAGREGNRGPAQASHLSRHAAFNSRALVTV